MKILKFKNYYHISNDMVIKKANKKVILTFLAVASVFYLGGFFHRHYTEMKTIKNLEKEVIILKYNEIDNSFNSKTFREYISTLNLKYPWIAYSQAFLETDGFKSYIFKENNNLFGMKVATIRATKNIGEENGHAVYKNWKESVDDYAMYYNKYLSKLSEKEVMEFLSKEYATDPYYKMKLGIIIGKTKKFWVN